MKNTAKRFAKPISGVSWRCFQEMDPSKPEVNIRAIFFAAKSAEKLGQYDEAVQILLRAPRNQNKTLRHGGRRSADIQFKNANKPVEA